MRTPHATPLVQAQLGKLRGPGLAVKVIANAAGGVCNAEAPAPSSNGLVSRMSARPQSSIIGRRLRLRSKPASDIFAVTRNTARVASGSRTIRLSPPMTCKIIPSPFEDVAFTKKATRHGADFGQRTIIRSSYNCYPSRSRKSTRFVSGPDRISNQGQSPGERSIIALFWSPRRWSTHPRSGRLGDVPRGRRSWAERSSFPTTSPTVGHLRLAAPGVSPQRQPRPATPPARITCPLARVLWIRASRRRADRDSPNRHGSSESRQERD
jgi:hypothetical protein